MANVGSSFFLWYCRRLRSRRAMLAAMPEVQDREGEWRFCHSSACDESTRVVFKCNAICIYKNKLVFAITELFAYMVPLEHIQTIFGNIYN